MLAKKWIALHLRQLFSKLVWSPWLPRPLPAALAFFLPSCASAPLVICPLALAQRIDLFALSCFLAKRIYLKGTDFRSAGKKACGGGGGGGFTADRKQAPFMFLSFHGVRANFVLTVRRCRWRR
jgi:hypothetical protein